MACWGRCLLEQRAIFGYKKTYVKYESDYCSEEDYSSDEGGRKRKWFKPFQLT